MSLTLRVRTQLGTWRVANVNQLETFDNLLHRLEKDHDAYFQTQALFQDANGNLPFPKDATIAGAKLTNGHMIYAFVDEEKSGAHESSSLKKSITKDGVIVNQPTTSALKSQAFRPGMLPLRSMKMQWTLNEFISLDEQFVYKVKHQEKSNCSVATIDSSALQKFQNYGRQLDFRTIRIGYLYGKVLPNKSVKVEVIYEPPQDCTEFYFNILEDPKMPVVEKLAELLELQKVGWVFSHPPREKGFFFSGTEVLFAAEQQLEAAGGIVETSFVTVKVTLNEEGLAVFEAFQVSKQCMEMVAEGVLEVSKDLGCCAVSETFTAVVEGKNAKQVDNNFFLVTTPIEQFKSQFLVQLFPIANRIDVLPTRDDIKRQFTMEGKNGWTFVDLLADFQLLLYLAEYLSLADDIPALCSSILNRDIPINEGYKLLLRSIAGME